MSLQTIIAEGSPTHRVVLHIMVVQDIAGFMDLQAKRMFHVSVQAKHG